jgi:hypothetical protein
LPSFFKLFVCLPLDFHISGQVFAVEFKFLWFFQLNYLQSLGRAC